MNTLTIPEIIKEAYDYAVEKGFYTEEKVNLGEKLMLVISELGEALEAHRCGWSAVWPIVCGSNEYKDDSRKHLDPLYFEMFLKDTFEDEIADVFLRLFSLCGYMGYEPHHFSDLIEPELFIHLNNIGEDIFIITSFVCSIDLAGHNSASRHIGNIIIMLEYFCLKLNIPIEKHIKAKMAYNKTRPHKHGKEY